MKKLLLLFFLIPYIAYSQKTYIDQNGNPQLWGIINVKDFKEEPYSSWYAESIESYALRTDQDVTDGLQGLKVKLYMGTWCGDSKRWVPKFIEQWKALGLDIDNIEVIGLHNSDENYKMAPDGSESDHRIHRVPTFIFMRAGEEYARIVESPVNNLFTDLAHIALGYPSEPRYKAVAYLNGIIDTIDFDSLEEKQTMSIAQKILRKVSTPGELNTYAKKLYADGKIKKAKWVYHLNTILYPYRPGVIQMMGDFYERVNDLEKAKEFYLKSLELEPDNPGLIASLNDINSMISN